MPRPFSPHVVEASGARLEETCDSKKDECAEVRRSKTEDEGAVGRKPARPVTSKATAEARSRASVIPVFCSRNGSAHQSQTFLDPPAVARSDSVAGRRARGIKPKKQTTGHAMYQHPVTGIPTPFCVSYIAQTYNIDQYKPPTTRSKATNVSCSWLSRVARHSVVLMA